MIFGVIAVVLFAIGAFIVGYHVGFDKGVDVGEAHGRDIQYAIDHSKEGRKKNNA